jgi:uncharacterized iron-regulated protein
MRYFTAIFCRTLFIVPVVMFLQTGCAARQMTRMSDGRQVEFASMVEELKEARVVLIGETHDIEAHHQMQLDIIRGLHEAGVSFAIGLEMFSASSQRNLDQWVEGRIDAGSFEWIFRDNWKGKWWLYRDIFVFARDNHIPLIGLNIPRETMHKVYTKGFASLSNGERRGLPAEAACNANDPYTGIIQRVYVGHSGDGGSFTYFCEAQTLWNKGMALNISGYLKTHPDKSVVILAGVAHAMKQGIPAQMKGYDDSSCLVVLPDSPGLFRAGITSQEADYFIEE